MIEPPIPAGPSAFLAQLYELKEKRPPITAYESFRDQLLQRREGISTDIIALYHVVTSTTSQTLGDSEWSEFKRVAKEADAHFAPKDSKSRHWRNIATISALWSPRIVHYYCWDVASHREAEVLAACAKKYPYFVQDFVPRANNVLIARHVSSLDNNRLSSIGHPAYKNLLLKDLQAINALGKSPIDVYGKSLCLKTSLEEKNANLWLADRDGSIQISPKACLRDKRPMHYNQYLLSRDENGMLVPRPADATNESEILLDSVESDLTTNADSSSQGSLDTDVRPSPQSSLGPSEPSSPDSMSTQSPEPPDFGIGGLQLRLCDEVPSGSDITIEAKTHVRHADMLRGYAHQIHHEAEVSDSCRVRAAWLSQETAWARTWSPLRLPCGAGSAKSAMDAEVLYFSSKQFETAAARGDVFSKPCVIKEAFADYNRHTVDNFLTFISEAHYGHRLSIRDKWARQPKDVEVTRTWKEDFVRDSGAGRNLLDLQMSTRAHRPLFTMLDRFQLLNTVSVDGSNIPGKQFQSRPVDVASCLSFNILGMSGAFSGAHVDALNGTWIRNLDGIKLWMIVGSTPDNLMAFQRDSDQWIPSGRERLILLERGDVLLMPPGAPIIHAVHSPQPCLMEGGMIWDAYNIVQTLQSLAWICRNQGVTNEPIAYQLPSVIRRLEHLVSANPAKFANGAPVEIFQKAFTQALEDLRSVGCTCLPGKCARAKDCSCRQNDRRCTSWCHSHSDLPSTRCMSEEGTVTKKRRRH